jgi:hypothetical protein
MLRGRDFSIAWHEPPGPDAAKAPILHGIYDNSSKANGGREAFHITPAAHWELSISPHDIYERYVEKHGDSLSAFFPVTETEIGKIGTNICMDGHFPESARALGVQGAEVVIS